MPQDITTGLPVKSYEARTFPLSQRFIEDLTGKNLRYNLPADDFFYEPAQFLSEFFIFYCRLITKKSSPPAGFFSLLSSIGPHFL